MFFILMAIGDHLLRACLGQKVQETRPGSVVLPTGTSNEALTFLGVSPIPSGVIADEGVQPAFLGAIVIAETHLRQNPQGKVLIFTPIQHAAYQRLQNQFPNSVTVVFKDDADRFSKLDSFLQSL